MWRLILSQAGKFFLSKEAVPRGATMLSEHASKKAGQAALDKAAKVSVKKVKPGSAIRPSDSKEAQKFAKGIEKDNTQRWKDFENKSGSAKSKKIQENRKKAMEKSQRTKKEAKQTGVEETRPGGAEGLSGARRTQYEKWGGEQGFSSGGTVPKEKPKSKYKKLPIRTEKPKPKPPIEKILKKPKSKYRLLNKGGTVSAKKKTAKKTWNY